MVFNKGGIGHVALGIFSLNAGLHCLKGPVMNTIRQIMSLALALLLSVAAPAVAGTGADLKGVIDSLEQGYNSLQDVQADFSQRTVIASLKREERGGGELFIKTSAGAAMFRFNYTKPRQQIVSNGKKVWYYLPENRQVMVSEVAELFGGGNGLALNYLTGMGHVSRDFNISFAGTGRDKRGNYVLELVPKKQGQPLTKLQLTVSARAVEEFRETGKAQVPFPIVSSVVYDPLGNRTTIEFSKVKVNRGMGNDRFSFKVPPGVEVIKPR